MHNLKKQKGIDGSEFLCEPQSRYSQLPNHLLGS